MDLIGVLLGFVSGDSAANTPHLLGSVLLLLDLLSGALSLLLQAILLRTKKKCNHETNSAYRVIKQQKTYSGESVLRLELLGRLQVIVDQSKASGPSTTENGAEAKEEDQVHLADLEQL